MGIITIHFGHQLENTAPGAEFPRIFYARIGQLQLGFVLVLVCSTTIERGFQIKVFGQQCRVQSQSMVILQWRWMYTQYSQSILESIFLQVYQFDSYLLVHIFQYIRQVSKVYPININFDALVIYREYITIKGQNSRESLGQSTNRNVIMCALCYAP